MRSALLNKGDVLLLKNGMKVYATAKQKIICNYPIVGDKVAEYDVIIGHKYKNETDVTCTINSILRDTVDIFLKNKVYIDDEDEDLYFLIINKIPKQIQEEFLIDQGEFIVLESEYVFDSEQRLIGSKATCKKMNLGGYDKEGVKVWFFTSGNFGCLIEDLEPVRNINIL